MALLDEVKLYLAVSWQDEGTDQKLAGMLERGKARLRQVAGDPSLDFEAEGLAKALLLDYCRYANSHALELFEQNFQAELLSLQLDTQIAGIGQETGKGGEPDEASPGN